MNNFNIQLLKNNYVIFSSLNEIFIIKNPTFFDFSRIIFEDFFLAILCTVFGFFFLLLLLILRNTPFPVWVTRKIIHFIGGTFVGFILHYFNSLLGIIIGLSLFLLLFLILIFTTKFDLLKEYIILKECREGERNFAFLTNAISTLIILFVLLIVFNNYPAVFTASAFIVSWADASGEVFGRILPIYEYKIFNKKSLSGSLAVFISSFFVFLLNIFYYNLPLPAFWFWRIILGSIVCTLVEAFSWKWFDNILLPIFGSLVMIWFYLM